MLNWIILAGLLSEERRILSALNTGSMLSNEIKGTGDVSRRRIRKQAWRQSGHFNMALGRQ